MDEHKELVIISNNLEELSNVQDKLESWFLQFINDLFETQQNKIMVRLNDQFNEIDTYNIIWPIIKQELENKKIYLVICLLLLNFLTL